MKQYKGPAQKLIGDAWAHEVSKAELIDIVEAAYGYGKVDIMKNVHVFGLHCEAGFQRKKGADLDDLIDDINKYMK